MLNKDRQARGGELNTIIGKGSIFHGTINVESSIRVDGVVRGKLNCTDTLVVGKSGVIEAEIRVKNATIGGRVIGNLTAIERVELESNSVLIGDLKTKLLVIDEGAVFNGNCTMESKEVKKALEQVKGEKKPVEGEAEPRG